MEAFQTVGDIRISVRTDDTKKFERAYGILCEALEHSTTRGTDICCRRVLRNEEGWLSASGRLASVGEGAYGFFVICRMGTELQNSEYINREDKRFLEGLTFRIEYNFADMGEIGMSKEAMSNIHEAGTPLGETSCETLSNSWEEY